MQAIGTVAPVSSSEIPDKLIGPSPIMPVQVEAIYTKDLLDLEEQVTAVLGLL